MQTVAHSLWDFFDTPFDYFWTEQEVRDWLVTVMTEVRECDCAGLLYSNKGTSKRFVSGGKPERVTPGSDSAFSEKFLSRCCGFVDAQCRSTVILPCELVRFSLILIVKLTLGWNKKKKHWAYVSFSMHVLKLSLVCRSATGLSLGAPPPPPPWWFLMVWTKVAVQHCLSACIDDLFLKSHQF